MAENFIRILCLNLWLVSDSVKCEGERERGGGRESGKERQGVEGRRGKTASERAREREGGVGKGEGKWEGGGERERAKEREREGDPVHEVSRWLTN